MTEPSEGEKKAAERDAAGEHTALEKAAAEEAKQSIADRAKAFIAAFERKLNDGSPRTTAELAELKELLAHHGD